MYLKTSSLLNMLTNKELFAGLFFSLTVIFFGFCMFSIFISFYHCLVGGPFQHLLSYKCVLNVKCFKITNVGLLLHVTVSLDASVSLICIALSCLWVFVFSLICFALSLTYKYIYTPSVTKYKQK
jgi:hypothetical protein